MKINKLNNEELEIWLSLARTVGPVKFFSILRACGSLDEVLKYLNELANKDYGIKNVQEEIKNAEKIGAKIIPACDPDYPDILRNISGCPPVITTLGDISLLSREIIAIIGGRNSSINGRNFANKLALDLSEAGFIIVSGLARGIDTAANSVIYKNHPTIAVTASGIDVVYPRENLDLYKRITENGGLVITELPFATKPKPQYFPQRNRIISGLSLGVVVIEASKKSGSLITADFALNQGREVFAVSGFPLDSRCSGSNYLIKNGAKLVESADDIIESVRFSLPPQQKSLFDTVADQKQGKLHQAKSIIVDHINSVPVDIDELILASGLSTNIALMALLELETENKIERSPGNKISLIF
ncbi:DNA-processing protein DprA [Wolbachia endosymbiont of Tribolium confusum]|uniref:DNA-processing protein DprA n=1 Tax=Wolbachia endosymbiont of Tribolium confusum TaxID=214474 RepID=UPI001CF19766|nr:DNA-processing protein DprA [Wolbachia endosymbiont of Tribolium confusum]MCA7010967.1 DNA-processing protein DprA [Wolbachia endosymbiont of Tribolium confusum]